MSSPQSAIQSSDLATSSSTPSVLQSVEPRCKVLVSSLHPPSLFTPVSQSVEQRIKDDRQSAVSQQRHVRSDTNTNLANFYNCWTSQADVQGVSHEAVQAEGSHVSQPWQGEGRVTPAHTAVHAVHGQLHRHHVGVQDQL